MSFNIKNINKKIVFSFSLIGFFLSFISGLFSGNSFINLIFGSILSGVIIGIIIIIANLIIMVFLPELLESNDSDGEGDDSEGQVNIVMPEEGYTVQKGDNVNEADDSDSTDSSATVASDSGFKEVSLDDLKSLSFSDANNATEQDYNNDEYTSNKKDVSVGDNSIEDMAKAVKTVLKKD